MSMPRLAAAAVFVAGGVVPALAADPSVWPQWRGPNRDGIAHGQPWPASLTGDSLRQVWRVENLGPSYSGPVVADDRVFVTETVNKHTEVVTALDRKSGKEIWKAKWPGSLSVPFFAAKNGSWIRSTPAYDGGTLYVAGIRDVLVALGGKDGSEKWRVDFVKEFGSPPPDFGFVCSPLVAGDAVYVQAGGGFVKVDRSSGKVLWRTLKDGGGMNGSAFASPVVAKLAGKEQLVVQTRTKLAGVEMGGGEVLWSRDVPSFRGMNILTPVPVGDAVFTSTYGGNTQLVNISASGASDGWALKYEGNMTTPVVVGGHAYLLGKDRRFLCIELATGKEKWRTDERFGEYWSLVANGDKILALDQKGVLYLVKANPVEYEPLGKRKVADAESWAHLAVCGNEVYVRDLTGLSVFKWE